MTSAENSVSEPPNLKIFWGKISPELSTRLVPSAPAILAPPPPPPPPGHKKPSDGPVSSIHEIEMWNYKKMENDTWGQPPPKCFMKLDFDYFQHYSSKLVMLGQIDVHFNSG